VTVLVRKSNLEKPFKLKNDWCHKNGWFDLGNKEQIECKWTSINSRETLL